MTSAENLVRPTRAEVINDAIMSGQSALVLEGLTDIKTYSVIASCLTNNVVLRPVELIDGYGEGCQQVIQFFTDVENDHELSHYVAGNVVGVIDKDVRDFREEMPDTPNIVVLSAYSMESHFVCAQVLERCITDYTNVSGDLDVEGAAAALFSKFELSIENLYLGSVEALRGALDPSYNSRFGYSDSVGRLKDQGLVSALKRERATIVSFAEGHGLSNDLSSLKKIAKGKVLLDAFCDFVSRNLHEIQLMCEAGAIRSCHYCNCGVIHKCLYRKKPGVTNLAIRHCILGQFPKSEFQYLIAAVQDRLS